MKSTSLALWALPFAAAFAGLFESAQTATSHARAFVSPRNNINQANDNPNPKYRRRRARR